MGDCVCEYISDCVCVYACVCRQTKKRSKTVHVILLAYKLTSSMEKQDIGALLKKLLISTM